VEFRYTNHSLEKARRKVIFRGSVLLCISLILSAAYFYDLKWYFSLLPGVITFFLALDELHGARSMEKYREAMTVSLSDRGITIHMHGIHAPVFWPWTQVSIRKEKIRNGELSSFTINTGNEYLKTWEFTNDIESLSTLYKQICCHSHA